MHVLLPEHWSGPAAECVRVCSGCSPPAEGPGRDRSVLQDSENPNHCHQNFQIPLSIVPHTGPSLHPSAFPTETQSYTFCPLTFGLFRQIVHLYTHNNSNVFLFKTQGCKKSHQKPKKTVKNKNGQEERRAQAQVPDTHWSLLPERLYWISAIKGLQLS